MSGHDTGVRYDRASRVADARRRLQSVRGRLDRAWANERHAKLRAGWDAHRASEGFHPEHTERHRPWIGVFRDFVRDPHLDPDRGEDLATVLHEYDTVWPRQRARYADDAVLVFEHEDDARRVLAVLAKRLEKYGLRLHPDKTRMVEFCSPSKSQRGGSQRERSFAMLGFTHYWGRSRKGRWVVKRKTAKDRLSRALRGIGHWCRNHRHWKLREQQAALSRKLRGHYAYYGITGNAQALRRFRYEVERRWRKWLGRRSRSGRMSWERFARLLNTYPLSPVRVVHSVYR